MTNAGAEIKFCGNATAYLGNTNRAVLSVLITATHLLEHSFGISGREINLYPWLGAYVAHKHIS